VSGPISTSIIVWNGLVADGVSPRKTEAARRLIVGDDVEEGEVEINSAHQPDDYRVEVIERS
jgi:hypothetical protein